MKLSWPGLFFVGSFVIINSISLFVVGLYDFLFLLESVSVVCIFPGSFPFHLGYLICWQILSNLFVLYPCNPFFCFKLGSNVPFVIADFSNLSLLLVSLPKYCQFCWSFQTTNFWFHWLFSFLLSISFISTLIFIIFLLLLTLGVVCCFFLVS